MPRHDNLRYKVLDPDGCHVASTRYADDAVAVAQAWGEGTTVRVGTVARRNIAYTVKFGGDVGNRGRAMAVATIDSWEAHR